MANPGRPSPAEEESMTRPSSTRLTREEACRSLDITPDVFARIEGLGGLEANEDGGYEAIEIAAAAVRYARQRAEITDGTLAAVGESLSDVKPALERLAGLADHAGLSGDEHHRTMVEVAAFFTAFAAVMNRATAALRAGEAE
jgi:hypothetical protein